MKLKSQLTAVAVVVAFLAAPSGYAAKSRVVVLHTNDTHTHIDDGRVAFSEIAAEKARLDSAGENVILVDAGDYVQGTAFGGFDSGRSVIDIMNAAGYNVATLGNHEFDYGIDVMFSNAARATFRTVSFDTSGSWTAGPSNGVYRVKDVQVFNRKKGAFAPLDPNAVYRIVGNAFTLVEGGDGFAMFRSAKRIENGLATDYLVLAEYAKAFRRDADGTPVITSANSPFAAFANYPLNYEKMEGSGRITIKGLR